LFNWERPSYTKFLKKNNHILSEKLFEEYLNDFECEDLEDLYASVGEGLLLGENVIRHVFVDTQKDGELLQNIAKKTTKSFQKRVESRCH